MKKWQTRLYKFSLITNFSRW